MPRTTTLHAVTTIGIDMGKNIGGLARPMLRGAKKLDFKFTLTMAAYDLIKLLRLIGATA